MLPSIDAVSIAWQGVNLALGNVSKGLEYVEQRSKRAVDAVLARLRHIRGQHLQR